MSEYIAKCTEVIGISGKPLNVPDYIDLNSEIVRCRDCMHYNPKIGCFPRCVVHGANYMMPDDFCSHGKRKEVTQ